MSKIIGVTVGTSISPKKIQEKLKPVITINNKKPDEKGNITLETVSEEDVKTLINDALGVIENGTY